MLTKEPSKPKTAKTVEIQYTFLVGGVSLIVILLSNNLYIHINIIGIEKIPF